ncbi:hypothetical protein BG004_004151 [Podila humilis]|nr:hypothetical protein BG004_004151 [Podila humilis]
MGGPGKRRVLRIVFDSPRGHTSVGLPIYYGTPESPAVIQGTFIIEADYDFKGTDVQVTYTAAASVKFPKDSATVERTCIFDELTKGIVPNRPQGKSNMIVAGVTRLPFVFTVKNTIPSTFQNEFASVQYTITAKVTRGTWSKDLSVLNAVHITNSTIPPIPANVAANAPPAAAAAIAQYQQQLSQLNSSGGAVGGFENAQLVRSAGLWSKIQPFELLYRRNTVYWGQRMSVTLRIFPPLASGGYVSGLINSGTPIVKVDKVELVMTQRMSMRGNNVSQTRFLERDVFREEIFGRWPALVPNQIWSQDFVLEIPSTEHLTTSSVDIACLLVQFEVQFFISCTTTSGQTIKVVPYIPLEITAPRPGEEKEITLFEENVEHKRHVDHFITVPFTDFPIATVHTGTSASSPPMVVNFTIPLAPVSAVGPTAK